MRYAMGMIGLFGCAEPAVDPDLPDYGAPGPWSIGTATTDAPGPGGVALRAQVWYPSDEPQRGPTSYDGLLPGAASTGMSMACDTPRPVVLFSHGLGGVRWQSPFFVEHLAGHGFFVIAPDHPGSGLLDTDYGRLADVALRRPGDLRAAFEHAATMWPDCVDPDAGYAVTGHSFGGYTAFAAAGATVNDPFAGGAPLQLGDPRVWAVVALAPWDAGVITDGTRDVDAPVLVLTGRLDETTPIAQVERLWDPLISTPRAFGVFETGGHYSFSPIACVLESGDGCGAGFMPEERLVPLVQQSSAAFLAASAGVEGASAQVQAADPELSWATE